MKYKVEITLFGHEGLTVANHLDFWVEADSTISAVNKVMDHKQMDLLKEKTFQIRVRPQENAEFLIT